MPKIFTSHAEETYEDVELRALGVAAKLRRSGLVHRGRVTFEAADSAGYVTVLLALMPAGASIVLLDHRQQESVSRRIAGRCRSRLKITDAETTGSAGTQELGSVTVEELVLRADRRAQGHSEVR